MLIDTHCHLDAEEFDADRDAVVLRAAQMGLRYCVLPAVERRHFARVRALAHQYPGVVYALGIHPLYVRQADDTDLQHLRDAIETALDDEKFIGIGEIGLDFFDPGALQAVARQEQFYIAQLQLAMEFNLPVILHVRRSQDQLLKHLRRCRVTGGFAHAFNGSFQQAEHFTRLGFALGMGGAMTYPRALQIRRLAEQMPLQTLVLETDAPDIAPAWCRGQRNEPRHLARIADSLAELRAANVNDIVAQTAENALRVFPRLHAYVQRGSREFQC